MNDSSDDDELFSYSNKQTLTFSSNIDHFKSNISSSSSDESDDDDDNDDHDITENKKDDEEPEIILSPQLNPLLKQIAEYNEMISPSPPPIVPKSREKRYTKRTTRRTKNVAPVDITLLKKRFDETETLGNDDETVEEVPTIMLKIRVHGAIEKYEVKKSHPLSMLITDISKKEKRQPAHISLSYGYLVIDPTQSAKALGLTIADILECYIYDENADKEHEINIKIRSSSKSSSYKVHLNECVERVLKDFCAQNEGDPSKSKFSFDGEVINNISKTTFVMLDIIEGDIIDVVLN